MDFFDSLNFDPRGPQNGGHIFGFRHVPVVARGYCLATAHGKFYSAHA